MISTYLDLTRQLRDNQDHLRVSIQPSTVALVTEGWILVRTQPAEFNNQPEFRSNSEHIPISSELRSSIFLDALSAPAVTTCRAALVVLATIDGI